MRLAVVPVFVCLSLFGVGVGVASAAPQPHDEMTPADDDALGRVERDAEAPFVRTGNEGSAPVSVPVTTTPAPRPQTPSHTGTYVPKPMPLPEAQSGRSGSTDQPARYYEGDSCTGSGGYYDEGYGDDGCSSSETGGGGGDTTYVGGGTSTSGDDDDSAPPPPASGDDDDDDDDDNTTAPSSGDDDDDDDDHDSLPTRSLDRERVSPVQGPKLGLARPVERHQSPVSRLALLGALIVFPLRRRFRSL